MSSDEVQTFEMGAAESTEAWLCDVRCDEVLECRESCLTEADCCEGFELNGMHRQKRPPPRVQIIDSASSTPRDGAPNSNHFGAKQPLRSLPLQPCASPRNLLAFPRRQSLLRPVHQHPFVVICPLNQLNPFY